RGAQRPAVFGKIRVRMLGERLNWLKHQPSRTERVVAAYYNRPLVSENFSADETLDQWSGRSLDDWQTFYKGGRRLIEYLGHAGYNTLMLAVNSEGGAIYPSQQLEPTPKYDTGVFSSAGVDPQAKDVLGLYFQMFNRQQKRLIPVVQFGAPLPAVEATIRRGGRAAVGVEWIGSDGRTWLESNPTRRKLGIYYNVLHPRVQQAMLAVVDEIVARYEGNPSYAGLAVELSAFGYAQLPGVDWGFDDYTVAQFAADSNTKVPGSGPQRFAERAQFLLSDSQRPKWIKWRAERLAAFHQEIARRVTARRSDVRLYLTGTDVLASDDAQARLRPALPSRRGVAAELARAGIVPSIYEGDPRIEFLRPYPISLPRTPVAGAADERIREWTITEPAASVTSSAAAVFYHRPAQTYLAGLAEQGPWGKEKTKPWFISQMSPSGMANRRRFVRMLAASDTQTLVDGGWMLNLGQEESLADLLRVYRELPAVRFDTVRTDADPITVRVLSGTDRTFAYLVNDSPWKVTATLNVSAPAGCRVVSLNRTRPVPELAGGRDWTLELRPYDVVGVQFNAPGVSLSGVRTAFPPDVKDKLRGRIDLLTRQTAALRWPVALGSLKNAEFEKASTAAGIESWESTGVGATSV
ncbi:MAG: family 10 glycosylhydrolase, partial [Pirellulales bacterium]|nr:family 10 glycosylhydrolase [Pirellulales bacterium]